MFENNEDRLWYQWGLILIFIVNWIASVALVIWDVTILYKDWYKTYIVKRHRILVILLLILLFCGNLITTTLWIPAKFFIVWRTFAYRIRFFVESPIVLMTWVLCIVREWLLYYDMQHYRHIKNCSWKSKININSVNNHWTASGKVKSTIGNAKFLVIIIAILSYLVAFVLYLLRHVWFGYIEFLIGTGEVNYMIILDGVHIIHIIKKINIYQVVYYVDVITRVFQKIFIV